MFEKMFDHTMLENLDHTKLAAGAGVVGGATLLALAYNWSANATPKRIQEEKFQGGESYADPIKVQTGIWDDLKAMGGLKNIAANAQTLFQLAKNKGKPDDDKKMMVRWLLITRRRETDHCRWNALLLWLLRYQRRQRQDPN